MKLAGSKKFPTGTEPLAPDDDPEKSKLLNNRLKI
jgi:hypothetical protein